MKRLFVLVLHLMLMLSPLFAQQETPAWLKKFDALDAQINQLYDQQDWKHVVLYLDKQQKLFYAQPVAEREQFYGDAELEPKFYYDYACFAALAGRREKALQAFEVYTRCVEAKRVELNLQYINADTDLNALREDPRFVACMARITEYGDYVQKLKKASPYREGTAPKEGGFRYMAPNDSDLVFLRQHYKLDSIAGSGDELSKIKNLLSWVHNIVPHDGSSANPQERNAYAMIELCRKENRGVNCRMMAQILAEVYLSMGFKARFVTCLPRDYVSDCHVINAVYSCTLDKWVWVDPTFEAYVTDEHGTMLSIAEVRARLRSGEELRLNEDANWNHRSKQTKEYYLDSYMAKNLYYLTCMEESRYNAEMWEEGRAYRYYALMPSEELDLESDSVGTSEIRTADEAWFWQSPYESMK